MRRPVSLVLGTVLALVAATLPAAPALADPVNDSAYGTPLTAVTGAGLVWHPTTGLSTLAAQPGLTHVTFATAMASSNHAMRACDSTERAGLPIKPAATVSWCWESSDATTTTWIPQSVTTSGDADDDGVFGGYSAILSGWNYCTASECGTSTRNNDARVALVNYNNPAAPAYRWAYLAAPTDGTTTNVNALDYSNNTFMAAKAHMGGMAWYGYKLYVTATGNNSTAVRVFSTSEIYQVNDGSAAIGKTTAGYAAFGYQYVLPEIGYYSYAGGTCSMAVDTGVPCFASISLDRSTTPDSLVATEYFDDAALHGRVYRYSLGTGYLLATGASIQAYRTHVGNLQGVLSFNGVWYLSHSWATERGEIWALTTTSGTATSCTKTESSSHECWSRHPESLTYNYATGMVWSVTEWTENQCATENGLVQQCGRALFGFPRTALP